MLGQECIDPAGALDVQPGRGPSAALALSLDMFAAGLCFILFQQRSACQPALGASSYALLGSIHEVQVLATAFCHVRFSKVSAGSPHRNQGSGLRLQRNIKAILLGH